MYREDNRVNVLLSPLTMDIERQENVGGLNVYMRLWRVICKD